MDPSSSFQWIIVILLIILSFISSITETAMVSSSKVKLQSLLEQGVKRASLAIELKEKQTKVLATCLVANNIANICVSSLVAMIVSAQFSSNVVGIATGLLAFIIMIFSEVTPKNIATKYPEEIFIALSFFIKVLSIVLNPIVFIVNFCSMITLKLLRIDITKDDETFTEEELKTIVDISHEEGVIEAEEKNIIHNVFELGDLIVKEIMIPRADMTFASVNSSYKELINIFKEERYTRIPLYDSSEDNVVGILNMKDIFLLEEKDIKNFDVKKVMREAYFVYENRKVSEILSKMRDTSQNFCIVLDEYGETSGMITLEDILEEIVGDIRDEYDEDEEELIKKVNDKEYIVEGSVKIDDINEKLNINMKAEGFDSIGGVFFSQIDHLPKESEEIDYEGFRLKVLKMENNRITLVNLKLPNE
ncbi:MAG: hemolysin family protein [Eubacteriales bacterium]|nr:hemolysin family protein [Eubacteriales bacterium]